MKGLKKEKIEDNYFKKCVSDLKEILPEMSKMSVPVDPKNFAIWHECISNKNTNLSKEMKDRIEKNINIASKETTDELFFKYFIEEHLPKSKKAQSIMVSLLSSMSIDAENIKKDTENYSNSLEKHSKDFDCGEINNSSESSAAIKEIINGFAKDTENMKNSVEKFNESIGEYKNEISRLKSELEKKKNETLTDDLTGIGNRRYFEKIINDNISCEKDFSLILLDIDFFKKINDTYGHEMGDKVLAKVGKTLKTFESDIFSVSRFGGEEFACIINSGVEEAKVISEKIKSKMPSIIVKNKTSEKVNMSVGVAKFEKGDTKSSVFVKADNALYSAKKNGRNRVVVHQEN